MANVKVEWNLATLIPLGAMAFAIAVGWGKLTNAVEAIDTRLDMMEAASRDDDTRLRAVENGQSNMAARLEGIGDSIDELKTYQRETNTLLREYFQDRSTNQ
jgi:DNA repair ATPase RecN